MNTFEIFKSNSRPLEPQATGIAASLKKLADIRVVLFDVYGTLFISGSGDVGTASESSKPQHLAAAIQHCQIDTPRTADELLKKFYAEIKSAHQLAQQRGIEYPEIDIVEIWQAVFRDTASIEQVTTLAVEFESRANPVWPMPHLDETLARINSSKRMGIISNAQFFTLDLFLAFLDRDRREIGFEPGLEVFSYQEKTAKPGLTIYETAVSRLSQQDLLPANVLYVGNDMLNDIMPAQAVGFQTALFAGDQRSLRLRADDSRIRGVQPDIIVNCLTQIPDCL